MVGLTTSVALKRSFIVLVIFPLIITGVAIMCATVPLMCLSFLNAFSTPFKVGDRRYADARLPSAQLLLRHGLWSGTAASLASAIGGLQHGPRFASLETRLADERPLLRRDLPTVPGGLSPGIQFIRFDVPTLAPMAVTRVCMTYPAECTPQQMSFNGDDRIELTKARWLELKSINRAVNSSIYPERNEDGLAGEKWLLSPDRGDCNDYAVTKRHQLIAGGWPARAVLLSEVVTGWGEHHLVTVVRTNDGDLVLDNLNDEILPWSVAPYRWVRIQMPRNPNYWASISERNA